MLITEFYCFHFTYPTPFALYAFRIAVFEIVALCSPFLQSRNANREQFLQLFHSLTFSHTFGIRNIQNSFSSINIHYKSVKAFLKCAFKANYECEKFAHIYNDIENHNYLVCSKLITQLFRYAQVYLFCFTRI